MVGKKRLFCRYNFGKLFQFGHGNAFKISGTIYTPTGIIRPHFYPRNSQLKGPFTFFASCRDYFDLFAF